MINVATTGAISTNFICLQVETIQQQRGKFGRKQTNMSSETVVLDSLQQKITLHSTQPLSGGYLYTNNPFSLPLIRSLDLQREQRNTSVALTVPVLLYNLP